MSNGDTAASAAAPHSHEKGPLSVLVAVFRGVGQVDFQSNILTGILITIALFSVQWQYGVFGLLGSAVQTGTSALLGVKHSNIRLGLEGFSGCLTALACYSILGWHVSTWLIAVGGAIACSIINASLSQVLGTWNLPAGTAPFCIVSGVIAVGAPSFERLWHTDSAKPLGELPTVTSGPTNLSAWDFFLAFFNNIGQIFFMDKWWSGLIMLIGLACAGRLVAATTVFSSLFAILFAWALGAPAEMIAKGLYGYNGVLVGLALAATFMVLDAKSAVYAVLGVGVSVALTAAMTEFFGTFGGHTFTWPFNLTMWAFLAAVPLFGALKRKTS